MRRTSGLPRLALMFTVLAFVSCGSPGVSGLSVRVDPADPRPIAGGSFEASGVVHVAGTNGVLFVNDNQTREIFWMELTAEGTQKTPAVPVPLGADVTDMEGMTTDGAYFYVVGSQSKRQGFEGDGLVRFRFDPKSRTVSGVERVRGLKAFLAAHVAELHGTERRLGDKVLNIEAIAWDPGHARLLLGLRAPVIGGESLVVPLKMRDAAVPLSPENLEVDGGKAMRLQVGGAGMRSLEYDGRAKAFRLITGAALNDETRDFRVLEWNGDDRPAGLREITRFSRRLKPEGIAPALIDSRQVSVLVFDTSRFLMQSWNLESGDLKSGN